MRLKAIVLAVLASVCIASVSVNAAGPDYKLGGGLGFTQIGDEFYLTTSAYPDIAVGKLGLGLELTLNFSKDGIRTDDWNSTDKAIARSIRYIRWGYKNDPFYLQFGQLYNTSIGTGVLVDNYMNIGMANIKAGQRRLGLVTSIDTSLGGVEAMVNDTLEPTLYAGRVFVHPSGFIPFMSGMTKLSLGVSVAADKRNFAPYNGLNATAVDVYYPISRAFEIYAHSAKIAEHGDGQGAGIRGQLGPITYVAEARSLDSDFVPSAFSKGYEDKGVNWNRYPANGQRTEGYLLGADLNMMQGDLKLSVKQELNRASKVSTTPRVTGELAVKGNLLKAFTGGRDAELSANYTKELVDPVKGDANGYLKAKAKVAVVKGLDLNYTYDAVYLPNGEVQRNMAAGMGFGF